MSYRTRSKRRDEEQQQPRQPHTPQPEPSPEEPPAEPERPTPPVPPPVFLYDVWRAVMDEKTCDLCKSLHGRLFLRGTGPQPITDTHPNCRCHRELYPF